MTNLNEKTQEELKQLWKSIKLTIVGSPKLNPDTLKELNTYLLDVSLLIDGDLPVIDQTILAQSLN